MTDLIGRPLSYAEDYLKKNNLSYTVVDNNFCVKNGTKLVTNVKADKNMIVLTVGEFIFDLKERQNGQST